MLPDREQHLLLGIQSKVLDVLAYRGNDLRMSEV